MSRLQRRQLSYRSIPDAEIGSYSPTVLRLNEHNERLPSAEAPAVR